MIDKTPATLRRLSSGDIPAAQRLRALAGWNQTDDDWRRLLAFEPDGCFAAEINGILVGTATTIRYGSLGWIGMLLVDPAQRRRGIGSMLLKRCMSYFENAGVETIKLDATELGRPVYQALGFRDEFVIERWVGTAADRKFSARTCAIWTITDSDAEDLAAFDAPIFGADRARVLDAYRRSRPDCALIARAENKPVGYALARRGMDFHQIGPVIGATPAICEELFDKAMTRLAGHEVAIDVLTGNAWAIALVDRNGLKFQRRLVRMFRGPNGAPGRPECALAICCPELG